MSEFFSGWLPEKEAEAKAKWTGSPPRFAAAMLTDVDISDPAFTLAEHILYWYNQGPVGSCFANAVVNAIQISITFAIANGAEFEEVQLSRRAVWYFGRLLDGSIGSRGDGGSITNAVRSVHEYGIPHEADWPYKPSHGWLEQKPPDSVIRSAKEITIKGMVDLNFHDADAIKRSIKSGLPPVIGIYWTYGWDTNFTNEGLIIDGGGGTFGHALVIVGWATWNGRLWWHILNSHGPLYPGLSPENAAEVKGWAECPTKGKSYAFWVEDSALQRVVSHGNAEMVAPVGIIAPSNAKALSWLLS